MDKIMRIRGEIPTFKRCCMCLPLRHGLIVWGYIRLVIGGIFLVLVTNAFFIMLERSRGKEGYEVYLVMLGFFVTVGGADIVLNVVLVYAGHTKDLKMLRAYYIYSFILWVLMIIIGITLCFYAVHAINLYQMESGRVWFILYDLTTYLAQIVIQAYMLLLVRSEFVKLSKDCEFRFVNNAAESACEMRCEEEDIGHEYDGNFTVKRDVIAITDTVADGGITANRYIVANGDKEVVYKNGSKESKDTLIY